MDEIRFDTLARSLTVAGSRRSAFAAGVIGTLGLLGLAISDDAQAKRSSGKCKPRCDECEKCNKGSCKKKNGKKRCHKGKCKPKAAGAPCTTFAGGFCVNGSCVNPQTDEANCGALGTACGPTQVCQAGSCFAKSTCPATTPIVVCPGMLATFCGGGGMCRCVQSTEGNVVCLSFAGAQCPPPVGNAAPCTTSATCPPGAACADMAGCCGGGDAKTCLPQCPTPDA
jgi:hypothetical protein